MSRPQQNSLIYTLEMCMRSVWIIYLGLSIRLVHISLFVFHPLGPQFLQQFLFSRPDKNEINQTLTNHSASSAWKTWNFKWMNVEHKWKQQPDGKIQSFWNVYVCICSMIRTFCIQYLVSTHILTIFEIGIIFFFLCWWYIWAFC